jgi:predicted regulator of Ras-like GTPase activity (Roadblock/LC7/MglB family)
MATQSLPSTTPTPPALDHRVITPLLDDLAREHAKLTGFGGMRGILLVDQDAKVIAKNSMFGLKKPWDMGGIAAALHGVAKQASQYFGCSSLDRVAITFGNMQFFVQAIGSLDAGDGRPARELLLVILADEKVKMGIVLVQMKKIAPKIVEAIRKSAEDMALIKLDERAVREYLTGLKQPV